MSPNQAPVMLPAVAYMASLDRTFEALSVVRMLRRIAQRPSIRQLRKAKRGASRG